MVEDAPRAIRGSFVKSRRRAEKPIDGLRACPACGTVLSKWNDGSLCNQCQDTKGRVRPYRMRGRVVPLEDEES